VSETANDVVFGVVATGLKTLSLAATDAG